MLVGGGWELLGFSYLESRCVPDARNGWKRGGCFLRKG